MLNVLLLTSKGAAAVTGGGFVTLSATLARRQTVPVAGLSLILGIDRFMSQARALTNLDRQRRGGRHGGGVGGGVRPRAGAEGPGRRAAGDRGGIGCKLSDPSALGPWR